MSGTVHGWQNEDLNIFFIIFALYVFERIEIEKKIKNWSQTSEPCLSRPTWVL